MATKKTPNSKKQLKTTGGPTSAASAVTPVPAFVPAAEAAPEPGLQALRKLNLWAGAVLLAEAVAVLLFGSAKSVPVTTQYLSVDQLGSQAAGHQVLAAASRHLFDVRLTVIAAVFLALFALSALVMATAGRDAYEARLVRDSNVARWLGFGLGGGVMIVAIALLSGISDLAMLLSLFVFMLLGAGLEPLAEKLKRAKHKGLLPHAVCAAALTAAAMPWIVFAWGALAAMLWNGHIPGAVYVIYGTTLVLFGCWALGSHFRVTNRGQWADALYAEKMYLYLGVAAATVLAWQIFARAL